MSSRFLSFKARFRPVKRCVRKSMVTQRNENINETCIGKLAARLAY